MVWVHTDRVYIASSDSLPLEPGMILTFKDRDKKVATGEVTAVHDRDLIAAKLTAGSLAKVKHLDRLQITAERPVLRAPSLLRVGYPAAGRNYYLFDCPNQSLGAFLREKGYSVEAETGSVIRLVRDPTFASAAMWPDTLLICLFVDSADEEIALERGDLDVAVFWPGEPSRHIRDAMYWEGNSSGQWARGILAADAAEAGAGPPKPLSVEERRAIERLNQELFRGDLTPWQADSVASSPATTAAWFYHMPWFPGGETIQRFLNRELGPGARPYAKRVIRLSLYRDEADSFRVWPGHSYLFSIRCPVISAPRLRHYLSAIGMDSIANLFTCDPPGRIH